MPEADRFLRLSAVRRRTGVSKSSIYRWMKKDKFPKQVKLLGRSHGWREPEINHWMADPSGFRPKVDEQRRDVPSVIEVTLNHLRE